MKGGTKTYPMKSLDMLVSTELARRSQSQTFLQVPGPQGGRAGMKTTGEQRSKTIHDGQASKLPEVRGR